MQTASATSGMQTASATSGMQTASATSGMQTTLLTTWPDCRDSTDRADLLQIKARRHSNIRCRAVPFVVPVQSLAGISVKIDVQPGGTGREEAAGGAADISHVLIVWKTGRAVTMRAHHLRRNVGILGMHIICKLERCRVPISGAAQDSQWLGR